MSKNTMKHALKHAANATSKRKAGSALLRPVTPSPELAAVIGPEPRTRTEVTAAIWSYIKAHGLQDAADRRSIVPDAALRAVLGQDRVDQFAMPGLIAKHLTPAA